MRFSRGQVQILYNYLPQSIFSHDQYGYCLVTRVETREDIEVNRRVVLDVLADTLSAWRDDWNRAGFPDPRQFYDHQFLIGSPTNVQFEPYPRTLQCQRCHRVYSLQDLQRSGSRPGLCPAEDCSGHLSQIEFVQAHNCGRLAEIFVNRTGCPEHRTRGLYFDDTGRVATARWRCHLCGGAEVARLRQTPCNCAYSRHAAQSDSDRRMRVYSVTDPAVFRSWVVPFVNFDEEHLRQLNRQDARSLLLGRIWGILDQPVSEAIEVEDIRDNGQNAQELAQAIEALAQVQPDHPLVRDWHRRQSVNRAVSAERARVLDLLGVTNESEIVVSRRVIEHVAILDSLSSVSTSQAGERLHSRGDIAGAEHLRQGMAYATEHLGILDLRALEDFPIGLCAVGSTRVSASPEESILTAFPQVDGRTPLYVVVTATEAIYLQLDPLRIVEWLQDNGIIAGHRPETRERAWAWLYREVPGLRQRPMEPEYARPAAVAVRTALHSVSHVLLRCIEWSGYAAQSLGEYLIPEGLACVLYANRYTETKMGGLLMLFEQRLYQWLESAFQQGMDCVFDPFCSDSGGACVGCLHREYNCPQFNRELSRATLYAGPVPPHRRDNLPFGRIRRGFWP